VNKKNPASRLDVHVTINCSRDEYEAICQRYSATTCRSLSEYARKVLLSKPIAITHRNLSLDRLIDTMTGIKNELEKMLELKTLSLSDKMQLNNMVQEIKELLIKIFDQCISNIN
jgi:hypothetical protein